MLRVSENDIKVDFVNFTETAVGNSNDFFTILLMVMVGLFLYSIELVSKLI